MIELGDTVKCIHSGYMGVVTAKHQYINGCTQFTIAAKWDGKSDEPPTSSIDEQSLEIIKKLPESEIEEPTGGPNRKGIRQRGF